MSNYNLSDNVQDDFPFELRDKKYIMRYPLTEEIENLQALNLKLEEATDAKDADEVKAITTKLENFLYDFISPVDHDQSIRDALKVENIKVMKNFNTMINSELAIQ